MNMSFGKICLRAVKHLCTKKLDAISGNVIL